MPQAKHKLSIGICTCGVFLLPLIPGSAGSRTAAHASRSESTELSVAQRISGRSFPSIFQPWNGIDNLPGEDRLVSIARHDLLFHAPDAFGLQWNSPYPGLGTAFTPASIVAGKSMRAALLQRNPHMILLAEIRYHDAYRRFLPDDSPWWLRDKSGRRELGWPEGGYNKIDFANPAYQEQAAAQAKAAVQSGVFDGVMLDWWLDDPDRLALLKRVRTAVGPDALILVNSNEREVPQSASLINGIYMECISDRTVKDWDGIAATLRWADTSVRQPRIDCLETWFHTSRADLNLMRATTCMALTESNGYCLFCDPDPLPTPDHLHDWYTFWEKRLGRALAAGAKQADGSWRREFQNGTAVYNPMGSPPVTVRFRALRRSAATGKEARSFTVPPLDGDLLLK